MKLLLDQNLSRRLLDALGAVWQESAHVGALGMGAASDKQIWDFAAKNEYCLVSKDNDFLHFALLFGAPPKTIIIATGNASTGHVLHCLLSHKDMIDTFYNNSEEAVLVIP